MSELPSQIPGHCQDCPFIFPTLEEYINLEAELYQLKNNPSLLEYRDAIEIEARIEELEPQVRDLENQLVLLRTLTIGCAGVKLARVEMDDEHLESLECQSPLKDLSEQ